MIFEAKVFLSICHIQYNFFQDDSFTFVTHFQFQQHIVCLRQKRSSDAEDLDDDDDDSSMEEDLHNDSDPSATSSSGTRDRTGLRARTHSTSVNHRLNNAVDHIDVDDDGDDDSTRGECTVDGISNCSNNNSRRGEECTVGISTRHILDDIIRIESESIVEEENDDDDDDDEGCDDQEVEDDDEAMEAETSLMNGAASSGKEDDQDCINANNRRLPSKRNKRASSSAYKSKKTASSTRNDLNSCETGGDNNIDHNNKKRLAKFKIFQSWGVVVQDETVNFV